MSKKIDEFRELLEEEATPASAERAARLLGDALGMSFKVDATGSLLLQGELFEGETDPADMFANSAALAQALQLAQCALAIRMPSEEGLEAPSDLRLRWLAISASLQMAFGPEAARAWGVGESTYSFVADVSLQVFHHTYFGILEEWGDSEASIQTKSLFSHCARVLASHQVSTVDRQTLLGLVAEINDDARAGAHFQLAFEAVKSEDHEFMTVTQRYWDYLIEARSFAEAARVSCEAYSRAEATDLEEAKELMDLTLTLAREHRSSQASTTT